MLYECDEFEFTHGGICLMVLLIEECATVVVCSFIFYMFHFFHYLFSSAYTVVPVTAEK